MEHKNDIRDWTEEKPRPVRPEELGDLLRRMQKDLITSEHPFADFMRERLRDKGILQQNVFLAADLPERYGYKLIAEQKRTRRRDVILRLCLAAELTPEETNEALIRYGMAPLFLRFPRDLVIHVAMENRIFEIHEVDALLREHGLAPLLP